MYSRIIIVNPPGRRGCRMVSRELAGGWGYESGEAVLLPPLELIYIALSVRKKYPISFFDLQAYPDNKQFLERVISTEKKPLLISNFTPLLQKEDTRFIKEIKDKYSYLKIFLKLSYAYPKVANNLLKGGFVDVILLGEVELLINRIIEGERFPCTVSSFQIGKSIKAEYISNLEILPELNIDFVDESSYRYILLRERKKKIFTYQSSRGCPYPCGDYCPYPLNQGKKWRAFSAKKMFQDILYLVKNINISLLSFRDALFTYDRQRIVDFCNFVLEDNLKFKWWCETRFDKLDSELLTLMSRAGLKGLSLGLESGDESMLFGDSKKGVTLSKVLDILNNCRELKIRVHVLILVGLPGESRESIKNSFNFIRKLGQVSLGISALSPYPGTPFAENMSTRLDRDLSGKIFNLPTKYLTVKQLEAGVRLLNMARRLSKSRGINYWWLLFLSKIRVWLI